MAGNMTINNKGDKAVHIRTTGNDKNRFTVVLICSANGSKYPPICIFKGKQLPREEVIPKGIICWFQENGWMTSDLMKKYIEFLFKLPVIPVGLTSICQPLDVSINKPFKDNMQKEWHEWMCQGGAGETEASNLKRARISDVYESEDDMVYEKIDKLIAKIKEENLDELDDSTEIVDN
ncbi:pogo transposable element with KRAB domain [Rhizophagus clarus]|uniref:Pogo transposable element with KRAB domain n=1 Tax=Rhizophagus clarus TaxID=94130 RepID=A0A8H3L323_9GLOM|nr:pogo transposable element with KRAB domain [Rhizophagus clarus]